MKSNEQTLFRRTQVRQILAAYRQQDRDGPYIQQLRTIFSADGIRYHIRDAVARWLGSLDDPTVAEMRIALTLDNEGNSIPRPPRTQPRSSGWLRRLSSDGAIDRWLSSDYEMRRTQAIWRLRTAVQSDPTEVETIVRRQWKKAPHSATELLSIFQHQTKPLPEPLVELLIEIINSAPSSLFDKNGYVGQLDALLGLHAKGRASVVAGAILKAWLNTWFTVNCVGNPFPDDLVHRQSFYWIRELAKADPAVFLDATIPAYMVIAARADDGRIKITYPAQHPFSRSRKKRPCRN